QILRMAGLREGLSFMGPSMWRCPRRASTGRPQGLQPPSGALVDPLGSAPGRSIQGSMRMIGKKFIACAAAFVALVGAYGLSLAAEDSPKPPQSPIRIETVDLQEGEGPAK